MLGPFALIFYVFGPTAEGGADRGRRQGGHLQFDGMQGSGQAGPPRAQGSASPPVGFGSFGAASPPVGYSPFGAASPPVGYGTTGATSPPRGADGRVHQQPVTVTQAFRPSQPEPPVVVERPQPSVPAGWKADPVGRHQFRYWDGFKWTDNVADGGTSPRTPSLRPSAGRPARRDVRPAGTERATSTSRTVSPGMAVPPRRSRSAAASSRTARAMPADAQPARPAPSPSWPGTAS